MSAPPALDDGPLVVACLRVTDLRPRVDPLTGAMSRRTQGMACSAADNAALEHAFRVAGVLHGRVLVVAAGPSSVDPALKEAQALGATVLRVRLDDTGNQEYADELAGDERALARSIVAALAPFGPPSLVLCGDRSTDRGTGALPAFLAHELGVCQALGLVRLRVGDRQEGTPPAAPEQVLLAERRLDGGWREQLRVPLPAVCSVEAAGVTLRRASLTGALTAEASTVPVERSPGGHRPDAGAVLVGPPGPFRPRTRLVPAPEGDDPRARLLSLTGALVAHDPPMVVGPVGAPAAADAFIDFLVRHGYLEGPLPGRPHDGDGR